MSVADKSETTPDALEALMLISYATCIFSEAPVGTLVIEYTGVTAVISMSSGITSGLSTEATAVEKILRNKT